MTAVISSSSSAINNSNILEIKTVQSSTFKSLIDALKEILIETNLEIDSTGLRIIALDASHIVLCHLKLEASQFEVFKCTKKLYVGINMLKLHMLIKTLGSNDVLTMFIESNDSNKLGIQIENPEKNVKTIYKLNILDINILNITIPPADFQVTMTMPAVNFQKIIRDMHNLADYIEIRNVEEQLCFSCKGDFCTQETILGTDKSSGLTITRSEGEGEGGGGEGGEDEEEEGNSGKKVKGVVDGTEGDVDKDDNDIIQGVFSLKYMSMFTKFTNLCTTVEIFLKNNFPLILRYRVASLGVINLVLAQQDVDISV